MPQWLSSQPCGIFSVPMHFRQTGGAGKTGFTTGKRNSLGQKRDLFKPILPDQLTTFNNLKLTSF